MPNWIKLKRHLARKRGVAQTVGTCRKLRKNRFKYLNPSLLRQEKRLVKGVWV